MLAYTLHMKRIDLSGRQFSRLSVIEVARVDPPGRVFWRCHCDCGREAIVMAWPLTSGRIKSCGCYRAEKRLIHGHARRSTGQSPEYKAWAAAKSRCFDSGNPRYEDYGAIGITMAREWCESFASFLDHIGRRPSSELSLDRIDPYGNYEPGNVRWATASVQQSNKRNSLRAQTIGG